MDDIDWWYVGKDGEKTGPASIDVLEGLWLAGELDGLSLVWREGLADYIPVAESELRNYFQGLDGEDDEDVPDAVTSDQQKEETATRSEVKEASTMWSARDLWERQWAAAPSELGKEYYANLYTQESSWEPPNQPKEWDEVAATMVRTPWMLCWSATGDPFWLNTSTNERVAYVKDGPHPSQGDSTSSSNEIAFIPADTFGETKPGYIFKSGPSGTGYYRDAAQPATGATGAGDAKKRKRKNNKARKWKKPKASLSGGRESRETGRGE